MKKVTIALFILLCVVFAGRCYYESQKPPELSPMQQHMQNQRTIAAQTTNKQISNYAGVKVRGSVVRALFSLVDALNEQEVFPINVRYDDVLPDSYEWTVQTTQNLNSGDFIRDSAWFEVVIQDQLPEGNVDMYLDTITIRAYEQPVTTINSTSPSGE